MMEHKPILKTVIAVVLVIGAAAAIVALTADPSTTRTADAEVIGDDTTDAQPMAIEVAEDGTRFVFGEAPVLDDGYPAYGNGFVTQGYLYPEGTLSASNGVLAKGDPEFPDDVVGEWTCWGYFVGDGAHTTEGPWVITTQVFEFHSDVPGANTIVTVGSETPAGAGPAVRSVIGGTGEYASSSGEVAQVTLGHNASDGVNAAFRFELS